MKLDGQDKKKFNFLKIQDIFILLFIMLAQNIFIN